MAFNAASHNAAGAKTAPVTENPPPVAPQTKSAIKNAEKKAKFEAKKAKQAPAAPNGAPKEKPSKAKAPTLQFVEKTPLGEKKRLLPLDDPICQSYHPKAVESAWDAWWEKAGFYKPQFDENGKVKPKGSFVVPIPPPNCTGILHCGHAVAATLQDALVRYYRMRGYTALYVPGSDHAGISLQAVVEKRLMREKGLTRHDLGRQAFTQLCHDWKDDYKGRILTTLRRLGGSMDWSREAFTMDPNLSAAVTETFVRLRDEGLIYRANKLVNWCTQLRTTLSNIEVDDKEISGTTKYSVPGYDKKIEFGTMWYFKYPIDGSEDTIEIATTRPETMLGDSGIAVNPSDERYKHMVGKKARHPFLDRLLPIVADDYVKADAGTGAVKMTPAHDANDFEVGKRQGLQFINIYHDDGTMNDNAGPFAGQRRYDARYTVLKALEEKGLYTKKENNPMTLKVCSRSGDIIEPLLKPQWWMSMKGLAEPAIKAVENGDMIIRPESTRRNFIHWLANINDWCLSRQLVWGHPCPAWRIIDKSDDKGEDVWVTGRDEAEAQKRANDRYPGETVNLEQDPDVLDTWFSSGLWPFSTLGWPKETADYKNFYPTSVLETGWDIIFFWVARMVMLGIKLTGQIPFKEVYCHGLIRDSEGRKMSKSLGNTIDPINVIEGISLEDLHATLLTGNLPKDELEKAKKYQSTTFKNGIPECGTDALRFTLAHFSGSGGEDVNLNIDAIHMYRRFCNKVWQATKFGLGKFPDGFVPLKSSKPTGNESLAEKWILHKFTNAAKDYNDALTNRLFGASTRIIYTYFYDLCDTYIENSKTIIAEGSPEEQTSALNTLYTALEGALQLMHPYMPFVTEELWQRLPRREGDNTPSIMVSSFPEFDAGMDKPDEAREYDLIISCSKTIRALTHEYAIKDGGEAYIKPTTAVYSMASAQEQAIKTLSGKALSKLEILKPDQAQPEGCIPRTISSEATLYLQIKGRIDVHAETEKATTKLKKTEDSIKKLDKIAENMRDKPEAAMALEETELKVKDLVAERGALNEALDGLKQLSL